LEGINPVSEGHYELGSIQKCFANNLPKMGKTPPNLFALKDKVFPRKQTTSDIKEHFNLLEKSRENNVLTEKEYMSKCKEILGQL
jgi:hypothetical protein